MLERLLNPACVAVIGGSDDTSKPGGRILANILARGYAGRLFAVNPKSDMVQGVPAVKSVPELPEVPDLAYIAIPSKFVRQSLTELAEKGVKAVVVLSAGFGEQSAEGKAEEERLKAIADESGMIVLGPNCLGVMSCRLAGKFAGILPLMAAGGADFLSGSGATVDYLAEQATKRGLAFNSFLTVGNSAQTGVTDLLGLFDQAQGPGSSPVKLLYMETVNDPKRLLAHARSLAAKGCTLAGIKAGTTEAGNRAAASHTGALVSSDTAVQALFDKAGIIRVASRIELVDLACALTLAKGRLDGRRVAIVTDAGGPGVMLADELNRQGLEVPALKPLTRALLAEALPPSAGTANPVDCLPSRTAAQFARVFEILAAEEADNLDYIMVVVGDSGLSDNWAIYQEVIKAMDRLPLPVFPSFCTAVSSAKPLADFTAAGKCYFEDEVAMAKAIGRIVNRPASAEPVPGLPGYDRPRLAEILAGKTGILDPDTVASVLDAAGIRTPGQRVLDAKADLPELTSTLPFPWVMKVVGPLHKTDVGGVKVGIADLAAAAETYDAMMAIPGASGVLVQQMVRGTEVIIGAKREEPFGHLVAFGLGGIYAEALKDIQFRLAPLAVAEALDMIDAIAAAPIVKGVRGEPGMDLKLLADQLVRVGLLATDFPQIAEMDLNPVKGTGTALYAVDARIILGS